MGFSGIGVSTPETGWVAASASVYETHNGGLTWSLNSFGRKINRFRFVSESLAYAAGSTVYRYTR